MEGAAPILLAARWWGSNTVYSNSTNLNATHTKYAESIQKDSIKSISKHIGI